MSGIQMCMWIEWQGFKCLLYFTLSLSTWYCAQSLRKRAPCQEVRPVVPCPIMSRFSSKSVTNTELPRSKVLKINSGSSKSDSCPSSFKMFEISFGTEIESEQKTFEIHFKVDFLWGFETGNCVRGSFWVTLTILLSRSVFVCLSDKLTKNYH